MSRITRISLVLALLMPVCVLAQPSIDSVVGYFGDESPGVVITGSGFGAKATSAPARWLDFNDGTAGNLLDEPLWYRSYGAESTCPPVYSLVQQRDGTNSGNFHGGLCGTEYAQQTLNTGKLSPPDRKMYASFYIWSSWGDVVYVPSNPQTKTWRFHAGATNDWVSARPTFQQQNNIYDWGVQSRVTQRNENCPADQILYHSAIQRDEWLRIDLVLDMGDHNTANGSFLMYINGVSQGDNLVGKQFLCTGDDIMDNFQIAHYLGNTNGGPYHNESYYDDVYVDTTWQRVVIGESNIYESCNHIENLIPTSWSDNQIEVTVNTGTFATDDVVFLYVIDGSNNVSVASDPIIIDEGLVPVDAPAAPTLNTATPGINQVYLSWSASTGATGYYVMRSTTTGGPYSQVGSTASTSLANTGLTSGTTYYYVIRAYNAGGSSSNSNEMSATPTGAAVDGIMYPTNLEATAIGE